MITDFYAHLEQELIINQWAARQPVAFDTCEFTDYVFFNCDIIVREDGDLQRLLQEWTGGKK